MRSLSVIFFLLISWFAGGMTPLLRAQSPQADWIFVPDYTLPNHAKNHPGPRVPHPRGNHAIVDLEPAAILYRGNTPTQRLLKLLPSQSIPRDAFTYEMWICHHVNKPVAVVMSVRGREAGASVPFSMGFENWESFLTMQGSDGASVQLVSKMKEYSGFKQRWIHLVATFDGHRPKFFVNGQKMAEGHIHHDEIAWTNTQEFEIAAYMKEEPHMQIANLLHSARIHDRALNEEEINARFSQLKEWVHDGILYPELFHFTAGPYLNLTTTDSINLAWETDRPSQCTLQWGTSAKLDHEMKLESLDRLHTATINMLSANTPYFYRVTATTEKGQTIDSGLLTFKTAVNHTEPFRFAIVGDTESRPHINDQLCKRIWAERPNFMLHLGDLTDAGETPHRYEWSHEYFVGMTQLVSRIPVFAVPGNGESDLHWYRHFHHYPDTEEYYSFEYGNAAFFMLNSNQRAKEFAPGGKQYEWLEAKLRDCKAKWKFVCHHHATYTGEEDDYGNSWQEQAHFGDPLVQAIVPLYEKYGVDIAMFGHLHLYERSHPIREGKVDTQHGTVHLLAGGGGGHLEDFAPTPAFFSAKVYPDHHYVMMEILGDKLTMRMHALDGSIRDTFSIEKGIRENALKVTNNPKAE